MARAWMPFYVGDFLRDTTHLTAAELGAYVLLILAYWERGCLPTDDAALRRITRLDPRNWERQRPRLAAFFQMPTWRHKRIEKELARDAEKRVQRAVAGQASGVARRGKAQALQPRFRTHVDRRKHYSGKKPNEINGPIEQTFNACSTNGRTLTKKERESSSATSEPGTAREKAERGLGEEGFEQAAPIVRLNGHPLEVEVRRANGEGGTMPTFGPIGASGRPVINPSGALEDKLFAAAGGNLRGSRARDVSPIMRRICAGGVNVEADILPAVRELYGGEGAAPLQRWDDPALVAAIERNAAARLAANGKG